MANAYVNELRGTADIRLGWLVPIRQ